MTEESRPGEPTWLDLDAIELAFTLLITSLDPASRGRLEALTEELEAGTLRVDGHEMTPELRSRALGYLSGV